MVVESKEKILKALDDFGRISTTRVAGILAMDYNYACKWLEELHKERRIKKIVETNATYWEIKK